MDEAGTPAPTSAPSSRSSPRPFRSGVVLRRYRP